LNILEKAVRISNSIREADIFLENAGVFEKLNMEKRLVE